VDFSPNPEKESVVARVFKFRLKVGEEKMDKKEGIAVGEARGFS